MDHPWLLLISIFVSFPLIQYTFFFFFKNLREDLQQDGVWLLIGAFTDFSPGVTWTLLKLVWFVGVCTAYIYVIYKFTLLFA